jgi:hypothetical protein
MRESLRSLEFKDFEEKLSHFLNNLDKELKFWRGYHEKNGQRSIRYPVIGYACLDGDKIVAISYYITPKILSPRWIYDRIFRPKGLEGGVVVKKSTRKEA